MKYFVLKPKGSDSYAEASRMAMRAYANRILSENESLARELFAWADSETPPPPEMHLIPDEMADEEELDK